MEKLKSRLYIFTFSFAVLSIAFALLSSGRQKDFFYVAVYLGIIGIILEWRSFQLQMSSIVWPIIILGTVKITWYLWFQHGDEFNIYSDYFNGGKKLILGGLLVLYLTHFRHYLVNTNYRKWLLNIMIFSFIGVSLLAFWQIDQGATRAEMALNRATVSAYLYSTLSIFVIYLLLLQNKSLYYFLAIVTIAISVAVVILTGTRAAMIFHLPIAVLMTVYYFKKIHLKNIAIASIISILIFIGLYNKYIHPKIEQTYNEITLFQKGKDRTSLGARFSMWVVGIENFLHAPLSQSQKSRTEFTQQYVTEKPQYKSALEYINVHLHNEFIETLSLQGIVGGITLLWLYISIAWTALREDNTPLLFTIICAFVYGISDVIFLSSEAILFYTALISICGFNLATRKESI